METISGKCLACGDTKIINKGTEVEESCPLCMQNNIKLAVTIQKMDDLIKKVDEGFNGNAEQHKEIMTVLKEMIEKKADKWVERVLVWSGITITTIVVAIIAFLLQKTLF